MSKQIKLIPEEKKVYTIGEYFKSVLDNKKCRVIKFYPYGTMYAANKKTKKPARITIAIPNDLGNTENLKFLDDWMFTIVAIPRKVIEELKKEDKE